MAKARSLRCIDIGAGAPALILHAFGVEPRAYRPLGELLAERVRVVIPDLVALSEWWELWSFRHVLDCVAFTLDELGIERATLVGHSFGGGVALGLAAHRPDRTEECVFVDTLGPKRQLSLAREAARPIGLLRTASRPAAFSFLRSWTSHPIQLASAAVDAYRSRRDADIDTLRRTRLRCHVLWAAEDEILSREDGEEFARRLNASFTVAQRPRDDQPLTHDWVIDEPEVFLTHLDKLGLRILADAPTPIQHESEGRGYGDQQGDNRQLHQRSPRRQEQS